MDTCRVRVLRDSRGVDVALPAELPVAELLTDLVDLVLEGRPEPERTRAWHLVHPVRGPVPLSATLAEFGVLDGATLVMDDGPVAPPPVLTDDVPEAVAEALAAHRRDLGDASFHWFGGVLLAGSGAIAGPVAGRSSAAAAMLGATALLLSLAAGVLGRRKPTASVGSTLAVAAVPWWGAAAAAAFRPAEGHVLLAAAIAAAGAAAGCVAAIAVPGTMLAGTGGALAAALISVQLALLDGQDRSDLTVAAVTLVPIVVLLAALPALAPWVGGVARLADERVPLETVRQRVAVSRRLQEWLSAGLLVGLLPTVAVLAADDEPLAHVLLVLLAGVLALRARRLRYPGERVPLLAASGATLLTALVAVGTSSGGAGRAGSLAVATLVALGVLVARAAGYRSGPAAARVLQLGDTAAVAALIVVAIGVSGAFSALAGTVG